MYQRGLGRYVRNRASLKHQQGCGTTIISFFADICSPRTIANIRAGSLVEVNVVDPFVRKGYRFKGPAFIHESGSANFAKGLERLRATGSTLTDRVKAIVVIEVQSTSTLISPVYDDGTTRDADVVRAHRVRFARLHPGDDNARTPSTS
jgi:hypothetical protein